ncbi:hypothetical protein BKA70DRAFT_1428208 [Coprinopsis sp. MPI-PUGE-AT-0042]|nr:hypothetical protein BKA70DRAFT_1428208 [Coprinopsis sp. MPI-PUGE-AT-0042]
MNFKFVPLLRGSNVSLAIRFSPPTNQTVPHLSDRSRANPNVTAAGPTTSLNKPLEHPEDTTVTLPHSETWVTETPPQTQVLPGMDFRFEVVEGKECCCRQKVVVHPPCREEDVNAPDDVSSSVSSDPSILLNIRTLGLESVLPHDARDFTIAAVNLGLASRARAEALETLDNAIENLRRLIDSFNESNNGVALAAQWYPPTII